VLDAQQTGSPVDEDPSEFLELALRRRECRLVIVQATSTLVVAR
jgi:hypothetical protein